MKSSIRAIALLPAMLLSLVSPAQDAADALKNRNLSAISDLMRTDAVTAPEALPPPAPAATPAPLPTLPAVAADPVPPEPIAPLPVLPDLQQRLQDQVRAAREVNVAPAPTALPTAARVPNETVGPAPAKRGFFSRLFGSKPQEDVPAVRPTVRPPSTGPLGDIGANLPSAPAVDADNIRRNRNALQDMIAQSRADVSRQTTSGQTGVIGGEPISVDFKLDDDAWKKAGPNAWKYQGEWKNGTFHGQGHLQYADGWQYRGAFENGALQGLGMLSLPDGTKFEGLWHNGQMHGVGRLTYPDGWIFVGQWVDGRISGNGTLIHPGK